MDKAQIQDFIFENQEANIEVKNELSELELSYVGGGIGDVTWS